MRAENAYDLAEPIASRVVIEHRGRSTPLVFLLDANGVCPKCFITPFTTETFRARTWWENGSLGINYTEAPEWIADAFSIISSEINAASRLQRELTREEKKRA